ncbi:Cell division protein FtsQ [Labilithrix luteola]|uniref:Cell division protein FtsQ n=1 Tax=Labilithrix luteola TaxID=1391654 RepID=A0A0K1PWY0_9BACT|nr:FtsQ-type POTRA domain-containing protein [Labilithrix luteola]AKU98033.1 Cell division protein FtsQ [Labilithrix luteola]
MNANLPPPSMRNTRRKPREVEAVDGTVLPPVAPKPSVPPRASKSASSAMRVVWGVLGFALVVGIGGTVAWAARHYVKTSPRFAIAEVVTTGGKRRTPDDLMATAGVVKGENVFSTDLDAARDRLLADPWISDAMLSRQLPGTIFLHVNEREAAGLIVSGNDTYLVTREGVVIKRVEAGDPTDFYVVTGVPIQQLVDDREGATRTIRRALDLASDYDHAPLAQRSPLQEVHVESNGEMTLVVGKSTVSLHMGAPPYRRKLEQAVRVVAELDRRGAKPDAIMLDNEARPDRVVVRMR